MMRTPWIAVLVIVMLPSALNATQSGVWQGVRPLGVVLNAPRKYQKKKKVKKCEPA